MISIRKPTHTELKEYLWQHLDVPFTYAEVEGTRNDDLPEGFSCGRRRVCLGKGRSCFLQAKKAVVQWKMFPEDFVDLVWPTPIEEGRVVATMFRAPGFWTVNPCRIIYTIDEVEDSIEQFGFAYGTVGKHLASGEERFTVEYHHEDESVWYEVYCFSRVNHWLSALAYPYLRFQQYRFRSLSANAMKRMVATKTGTLAYA